MINSLHSRIEAAASVIPGSARRWSSVEIWREFDLAAALGGLRCLSENAFSGQARLRLIDHGIAMSVEREIQWPDKDAIKPDPRGPQSIERIAPGLKDWIATPPGNPVRVHFSEGRISKIEFGPNELVLKADPTAPP